ncbi:hypothetical protein BT96DRAFT_189018 [Gymnopus androsaceus JB14]|uniref:Extracellular membrane protein CFEM domain-containing protein n=1 Tax=Gymnopus androsaceus JB14 TaxID=1447944 RepID=A0A6A4H9N5_9AGAR|nr:hypothetical protein BT96DRAFT_189018 [Gymnopus androsaceus JB14]
MSKSLLLHLSLISNIITTGPIQFLLSSKNYSQLSHHSSDLRSAHATLPTVQLWGKAFWIHLRCISDPYASAWAKCILTYMPDGLPICDFFERCMSSCNDESTVLPEKSCCKISG